MKIYYEFDEVSKTLIKKSIKNNGDIEFDFFEDINVNDLEGIIKSRKYSKWIRDNLIDNSAIKYKLTTPYLTNNITNKLMNNPINYSDIGSIIEDKSNTYNSKYLENYILEFFQFSEEFKTEHA